MRVDTYEFRRITIDGVPHDHDVVIEAGRVRKRRKGPSKRRKADFGHTPLTADEDIPWPARQLWVGSGAYGTPSRGRASRGADTGAGPAHQ